MSTHMPNPPHDVDLSHGSMHGARLQHGVPAHIGRAGVPMHYSGGQGMGTAGRGAGSANSFDIMGLLKALRRRWFRALMLGIVLSGVVGGIAWNVVPASKYTAMATLMVSQHRPSIVFDTKEREAEFRVFQKTQVAFLKSSSVMRSALRDTKVAQLPSVRELTEQTDQVDWLRTQIQVLFSENSEVMEISMSGERPTDLEIIVNAVVDAYMTDVVESEKRNRLDRLDKLRKLWDQYQTQLKTKQSSLKALADSAGASDKDALVYMQQATQDNLNEARRRRNTYMEEIRRMTMALKLVETLSAENQTKSKNGTVEPPSVALDADIERSPEIQALRKDAATLQARIEAMKANARNHSDPAIVRLMRDLKNLNYQIADRKLQIAKSVDGRMIREATGGGDEGLKINQVKIQLKLYQEYLAETEKELAELSKQAKKQSTDTVDVSQEQEEIKLALETARKVGGEVESLEVELQAPERVRVISRAELPRKKDEMKRLRTIGAAAGGAFCFALFAVGFLEFRARRISSVDEVVNNLGLNIVGSLPAMPDRPKRRLAGPASQTIEERWQKLLVESVDAMRTMLLHASRVESLKIVMVTSAGQGEGKTSLAGHLATSLARAGRRTLLVDCDLRRPTVHRLFDEPIDPGLCELLRGEISVMEAVRQGPTSELSVVTAGRADELAHQVLGQDRVREIFSEWKEHFEFVIVDTPPVLPVADSLFLSQHVDGVLFAILRDVSRVPQVQAAYDRLTRLGVRMLGAVVNGAQADSFDYSSGYYGSQTSAE